MALPPTVRVKLSSEAAESISITPVVVQEMPVRELVEYMLGVTGKDEARIRELLLRGTLVSGASRFRWAGWDAELEDLRELLATFPDPDPSRRFAAANCTRATLRGGRQPIEISREAGTRKGLFQRQSFWDALMKVTWRRYSRVCRLLVPRALRPLSSRVHAAPNLGNCAPPADWCGTPR